MSSVSIIKEGSPKMLVDRMLEYQLPSHFTAEMGEAVDELIKYMKTTADYLRKMHFASEKWNLASKITVSERTKFQLLEGSFSAV